MPIARGPASATGRADRQAPPPAPSRARRHILSVPYAHREFASQYGARWDKGFRSYVYEGDRLPEALESYSSVKYSLERLQEDLVNAVPTVAAPPAKAVVPHDHQRECVRIFGKAIAAGRTTFLNADDVGLGKTIETWLAILENLPDAESVLVVCPLAAVAHWRRTIAWLGDGGKRVVVMNYDRLKSLFEVPETIVTAAKKRRGTKARKVRTLKGVARFGDPMEFDVAVWDEAHRLRNLQSGRTKLAIRLYEACDYTFWLSATAGQTPLELGYLYPFMMEATGSRKSDLLEWEQWCRDRGIGVAKGSFGKWVWDPDGPGADEDLRKVNALLFRGSVVAGVRRSPTDIAGWPEMSRILLPVALEGEDREQYRLAWTEFRRVLELRATGAVDRKSGLVAALRFRQKSSLLRTTFTVDHVMGLVALGQQVAVSVVFIETLDVLRDAFERANLGVATISGRLNPWEKEDERMAFQTGRKDVCLYTVTEAISLHEGEHEGGERARSNVLHDLRWSAIDAHQVEGRTHRDGKFSQAYWMVGEGTVEEGIAEVVAGRMRSMGMIQGDDATVAAIESMLLRAA